MGVFLTPVQDNTTVFVDYNNDGTVDATYTLNSLQRQFIDDPNDGDLSGAHIWATGPFTMAYGQNSNNAPTGAPALDLGYVALPGTDFVSARARRRQVGIAAGRAHHVGLHGRLHHHREPPRSTPWTGST